MVNPHTDTVDNYHKVIKFPSQRMTNRKARKIDLGNKRQQVIN